MDVLTVFALMTVGLIAFTVCGLYFARRMLDRDRHRHHDRFDGPP